MTITTERIALLVFPNFSLLGYSLAVEMLRFANDIAGEQIYQSVVVAESPDPVVCSNGTRILPDESLSSIGDIDKILVCSSIRYLDNPGSKRVLRWLKVNYARGASVGALGSSVWVLAEAGLLQNRQCAVHWAEVDAFREGFPKALISNQHFVVDDRVFTSVGGDSVTDMMLLMIARQHGELFAEQLRGTIHLKPAQAGFVQQNLLSRSLNGKSAQQLQRVLKMMEDHIETPLPLPQLCEHIGTNARTLIRHTQAAFSCSPKTLYVRVRLERARSLLAHTSQGITDIAIACGFRSLAHFSSVFKHHSGDAPSQWRIQRRNKQRSF